MDRKYFKRVFDFVFSLIFLLFLIPLFLLIAILIKIESPGPVFFTQTRIGIHRKEFSIYKFRTMHIGAVKEQRVGVEVVKSDHRITVIGRLLRRFKIDELAQLINILIGDMSFIGPRPTLPEYLSIYEEWELGRFEVRPGLSGLAQINGNIYLDRENKSLYDVHYVKMLNFTLDITIILRTFLIVIMGEDKFVSEFKNNEM